MEIKYADNVTLTVEITDQIGKSILNTAKEMARKSKL